MTPPRRLRVLGPVAAALLAVPTASCAAPAAAPPATAPAGPGATAPASATAADEAGASPTAPAFDVPAGWAEQEPTSGLPAGVRFERLLVGVTTSGFTTNITVVSQEEPPGATLRDIADQTLGAARSAGHAVVVEPEPAGDFDGAEGLRYAWEMRAPGGGQVVRQEQVALAHGGRVYFVSLSADRTDPDLGTVMDGVRDSWAWS